ncbi:ATP-binding protein [Sulfitobacter pontiacus]|uniref:ATP-binding protein n=1 Tax=Sulfitobacter pontiacus TaxID=60137 RepID=UPI0040599D39
MTVDGTTSGTSAAPKTANFQVDSALLRELGERLVGQSHIALAELIKNSYDADATVCTVQFHDDKILVSDNGHGMSEDEFLNFWMRIGTTNKQQTLVSRKLKRPITGSKGVGRLSAQFLAAEMTLTTSSEDDSSIALTAKVDWDSAISAHELTKAQAAYWIQNRSESYAGQSRHGTTVAMKGLKQTWDETHFEALASEIWMIQPPIPDKYSNVSKRIIDPNAFKVEVLDSGGYPIESFEEQMRSAIENWIAIIEGSVERVGSAGRASVEVRFKDGTIHQETFPTSGIISNATWHIRIFNLAGRQPNGIPVQDARQYLAKFGGVGVYDAGFRLPYYGIKQDWLGLEYDHSHRKNRSSLLPSELHVHRALNDLPTQGRIFGFANVNTAQEATRASTDNIESGEYLKIQVTRDRLVSNTAFRELQEAVRWSIDYYATRQRARAIQRSEVKRASEPSMAKLNRIDEIVHSVRDELPVEVFEELDREFKDYSKSLQQEAKSRESEQVLLGPLATAGISALALEHEYKKEFLKAASLVKKLRASANDPNIVAKLTDDIETWLGRLTEIREIFAPLMDQSDREELSTFDAATVIRDVAVSIRPLMPTTTLEVIAAERVYLPLAAYAEWQAIFQNVFLNAANAMLDENTSRIHVHIRPHNTGGVIRVSDIGTGVDLATSQDLFAPFKRQSKISQERSRLGLGGTGLGLTIVRMIAENRRCRVGFVKPESGFATTFQLSWS